MRTVATQTIGGLDGVFGRLPHWAEWCAPLVAGVLATALIASSAETTSVLPATVVPMVGLVAWIVWQDLRSFTISDGAVLALVILAVAMRWALARETGDTWPSTVLTLAVDGGLPGGILFLFREIYYRRKGFDGLGLGDVKLAAAGGLLVGAVGFFWALSAASVAGLLIVAGLRLRASRTAPAMDRLAFGAVLAPALLVVLLVQLGPLLRAGP